MAATRRNDKTGSRPTQRRGDARRQRLLAAAAELLKNRDFRDITLAAVCARAGIPHGSARHFYPDLDAVWRGLLAELGRQHDEAIARPLRGKATRSWQALISCLIERSARFQRANPVLAKLTIGGHTPPELKRLDRDADLERARFALRQLDCYFVVPKKRRDDERIMYFAIEAVDTAFMLSMRAHGRLTSWWIEQAKRGAIAIMAQHFGELAPRQEQGEDRVAADARDRRAARAR
jgi:AcrR family transcriptional regulator